MGIEYSSDFGIGYEVDLIREVIASEEFERDYDSDVLEYLTLNLKEGFEVSCYGDFFTGYIDYIVTIKEPFDNTLDLTESKKLLDTEVERLGIKILSEFGLVGGCTIY
jgi:mRNA deadenylase 3'-5' endonuclease subunit Ccr4